MALHHTLSSCSVGFDFLVSGILLHLDGPKESPFSQISSHTCFYIENIG